MRQLLICHTDNRNGFRLTSERSTICPPGVQIEVSSRFAGPKVFVLLRVGADHPARAVSPGGIRELGDSSRHWRVDAIDIDGEPSLAAVGALEAEQLNHPDADTLVVGGDFGVGSNVTMRATNIGDTPAYFYATWELEDVQ